MMNNSNCANAAENGGGKSEGRKKSNGCNSFTLLAGWLIDGTGAPARRGVLIRVEGGVITSIQDAGPMPNARPDGFDGSGRVNRKIGETADAGDICEIRDYSDCTIIPALVDSHIHLTLSGKVDPDLRGKQFDFDYEKNYPLMDERMDRYRSSGILAVRDGGDCAGQGLRYRDARVRRLMETGRDLFVHYKSPGHGWRAKRRYGAFFANAPEEGCALAESIKRQEGSPDHIKVVNSGLNSLTEFAKETRPQFSREDLKAAVRAANARGLKTMVHANGRVPVEDAIAAGCASIEHGFFMGGENMERLAERRIFWVPTAYSMKAIHTHMSSDPVKAQIAARNFEHQLEQISKAHKMGVRIAAGSDAGGFGLRHIESFAEELKLFIQAGLTPEHAISAASMEGAHLLGLEAELGRIRPGMPATFLAIPAEPDRIAGALGSVNSVYVRGLRIP